MASRVSPRRWLLRDIPRTGILLTWVAFAFSIGIYFIDWSAIWRGTPVKPPVGAPVAKTDGTEVYTGAIFLVPQRGDYCWQRMLDNRTGQMWDKGYVNCDEAVSQPSKDRQGAISVMRMNSIGKAFRGGGE